MSFKAQVLGFPVWQMTVVSLIRFSEPIAFTSLFPYVYFMVRDFGIAKDPTDISRYTGYMGASFAFAQFLCCMHWGRLSDRVGRKLILLFGLLGSATSLLCFGFSTNFYLALGARTLMGALNGNIAVLQTMVGEIATERRHQSLAFSTLPLLWNVGCVVGPLIGGSKLLTRPHMGPGPALEKTGWDALLDRHPYSGSNIVVASMLCFSALVGFLFLEETHASARKKFDVGLAAGDWIRSKLGFTIPVRPWERDSRPQKAASSPAVESESESEDESSPLATEPVQIYGSGDDEASISSLGPLTRRASFALVRKYSSNYSLHPTVTTGSVAEETKNLLKALRNRNIFTNKVIGTMVVYFLLSFHCLIYSEFVPVFLAGRFQRDLLSFPFHIRGGFSWESQDIGTLLSSTGFVGCFIIIFLFPFLDRHVRTINGFRFACAMFPIAYLCLPYIIFTLPGYNPACPPWVLTFLLYACAAVAVLGSSLAFPQIVILIYRATTPKHRAFVNSANMSCTSLARCLAPLIWGALMSFFDKLGISQVLWNLLALIALFTLVVSLRLDEYDEDLKDEDEDE